MKLSVLAPGSEVSIQVSSQVAVAETVIVGTVPEGYFYMQGQTAGSRAMPNTTQGEQP